MGCVSCHRELAALGDVVGGRRVDVRVMHTYGAASELGFCSCVYLHVEKKRPTVIFPDNSQLGFKVCLSKISCPLHHARTSGFYGYTTQDPIWSPYQNCGGHP